MDINMYLIKFESCEMLIYKLKLSISISCETNCGRVSVFFTKSIENSRAKITIHCTGTCFWY